MGRTEKVRYVVVGLGNIAQSAVLPGFANAQENSELVGLISGNQRKRVELGERYRVERTGSPNDLEAVLERTRADVLYIATPNYLHREYTERAALAGVNVLCEKPMATSEEDCRVMIAVASAAEVKLMIAYRLHFDPANLHAVELARSGRIGEPRLFSSVFTHRVRPTDIRTQPQLGGGTLYDMGVYPINAARYLFGAEPEEVFGCALAGPDRRTPDLSDVPEVDNIAAALLRFSGDRVAQLIVSQVAASVSSFRLVGERGDISLEGAYQYDKPMKLRAVMEGEREELDFPKHDQFGAQLSYFSQCVLRDLEPEPSGEEGLADVRVAQAVIESSRTGRSVKLSPFARARRPGPDQRIEKPGVEEPELVEAPPPEIE